MDTVKVCDKEFEIFISEKEIENAVEKVATRINQDYAGKQVVFLSVLNGSFMFAADLMKKVSLECLVSFVKLSSYMGGTSTTGKVVEILGLVEDVKDKDVVIVEDIVDTGTTMHILVPQLKAAGAKSVEICCMLQKPTMLQYPEIQPKYVAMEIANEFIIGHGLDLQGFGRNLPSIYKIIK